MNLWLPDWYLFIFYTKKESFNVLPFKNDNDVMIFCYLAFVIYVCLKNSLMNPFFFHCIPFILCTYSVFQTCTHKILNWKWLKYKSKKKHDITPPSYNKTIFDSLPIGMSVFHLLLFWLFSFFFSCCFTLILFKFLLDWLLRWLR